MHNITVNVDSFTYQGLEEYAETLVFDFSQRQYDVDNRTAQSQTFKHQANLYDRTSSLLDTSV